MHEAGAVGADENVGAAHLGDLVGERERAEVDDLGRHRVALLEDALEAGLVREDAARVLAARPPPDAEDDVGHLGRGPASGRAWEQRRRRGGAATRGANAVAMADRAGKSG